MIGTDYEDIYNNSEEDDDGLRKINLKNSRLSIENYFVNFTTSEEDLLKKFGIFKPCHIGFYSEKFRSDEGQGFHYVFTGKKD